MTFPVRTFLIIDGMGSQNCLICHFHSHGHVLKTFGKSTPESCSKIPPSQPDQSAPLSC